MLKLSLSSLFDFESGYRTLLDAILEELPKHGCLVKPRSFSNNVGQYEEYFENVAPFKEDLDLLIHHPCNDRTFLLQFLQLQVCLHRR